MTRIRYFVWSALAVLCVTPALGHSDEAAVDAVLQAWAAAFNECSAARLSQLYEPQATLWGTNSRSLISSPEGVRFYFDGACAMRPPVKVELGERSTKLFGATAAISGVYTFIREGNGLPARFSFTLVRQDGKWLIIQHHSSRMPN